MITFYVLYHISFNFQHTQSYFIPKFCKSYKDSAGLDRFALAALERELWPRRPVHFFMRHSLVTIFKKKTLTCIQDQGVENCFEIILIVIVGFAFIGCGGLVRV